jgi:predicted O-methyltransferase YrrM
MPSFLVSASQRAARFLRRRAARLEWIALTRQLHQYGAAGAASIFTHLAPDELAALHRLASQTLPGANVLEIGSYLGASTCFLATGLAPRGGRLFCCDTWANETMPEGLRDTFPAFQQNTSRLHTPVAPLRKRSDALAADDLALPLHLVFIDGDHSYDAVRQDLQRVQPWLAPEAVVVLHDFSQPKFEGVTRVVGEALSRGEWLVGGMVQSLVWLRRNPLRPTSHRAAGFTATRAEP